MTEIIHMTNELNTLLSGVERNGPVCSTEIVSCSLYLLQNVPATRHAVLEYLSLVFEEAASVQLRHDHRAQGNQQCDFEVLIGQVRDVLHMYIQRNPDVWTPILSKWSIELLGVISTKLRHGNQQSLSLNEQLQQWMTCYPTNTLIQIASDCLAAMVLSTPEVCVDALLEASVKYAPHFDWVVAHIGSCFPQTVIERVLLVGLGEYYTHMLNPSRSGDKSRGPDPNKIPKLNSVVGILGHLAGHHARALHQALMTLFKTSLKRDQAKMYDCVVAFILRLASMSAVFLKAVASNIKHALTPGIINQLCHDLSKRASGQDSSTLTNVVVQLLRRCTEHTYEILELLLDIATQETKPDSMETDDVVLPVAQETCALIINWLFLDLQRCVHRQGTDGGVELPFLRALMPHSILLTKKLAVASGNRCLWLSRLLVCMGLHSTERDTAIMLSSLLTSAASHKQLDILMTLHQELCIRYPTVFHLVLTEVMGQLKVKGETAENKSRIINNLKQLVEWEKQNDRRFSGYSISRGMQDHMRVLSRELSLKCGHDALQLIYMVGFPSNIDFTTMTALRQNLQITFLTALTLKDRNKKFEISVKCIECLQKLSVHVSFQTAIVRHLLEVAISEEYREVFGGRPPDVIMTPASSLSLSSSLTSSTTERLKDSCLTPTRPVRLHDGIIGKGVKPAPVAYHFSQDDICDNRQLLVEAIWLCCTTSPVNRNKPPVSRAGSPAPPSGHNSRANSPAPTTSSINTLPGLGSDLSVTSTTRSGVMTADAGRDLALIIVELVTPDVMYNGIMWPEEDFMKVTTERDLLIKKKMDKNPVLWDILELILKAPGAMCYCSVIMRSLMSTMISYWETSRHTIASLSADQLTLSCQLLSLLRQGGMLAPPLSYTGEIISYLTPYEVHLILLSIWKYMKENPPDPRIYRMEGCDARYTETLRHIFESNIASIGHLYSRIFVNRIV